MNMSTETGKCPAVSVRAAAGGRDRVKYSSSVNVTGSLHIELSTEHYNKASRSLVAEISSHDGQAHSTHIT